MKELPSQSFTFGNYGADIPFDVYMDKNRLLGWLKKQDIIGYSKAPSFKHIEGHVAVMFEIDGSEYWSHIKKEIFDKL